MSGEVEAAEKKYKEGVDGLHRSGAGVDSDDEFEEGGYYVYFRWFSEIHSIMGGEHQLRLQRCWIHPQLHSGDLKGRPVHPHHVQQHLY